MSSYNVNHNLTADTGRIVKLWLGIVTCIPGGYDFDTDFLKKGAKFGPGYPVCFDASNKKVTPLISWKVKEVDTTNHVITVYEDPNGFNPKADDILGPIGTSFTSTGAAGKVSSVAAGSDAGTLNLTMTDAKLDGVSADSYLSYSEATAVASSGKKIKYQPNAYLFDEIYVSKSILDVSNLSAHPGIVMSHPEGIRIKLNSVAYTFRTQMKEAVPGVIQVLI